MLYPKRLQIAFLTSTNPKDRRSWSGLHYMLGQALEKHVGDVEYLGPVSMRYLFSFGDLANKVISWLSGGKRYHYSISVLTARIYAAVFKAKLRGKHFDFIFAPASYTEVAFLRTDIPIVQCGDSTITQLIDYYSGLSNLLEISKKELTYVEQLAINKSSLLVYSSKWAAESAIHDFGASMENVVVLPFGANLPTVLPREVVLKHQKGTVCNLLFVGVDWERKGGEIAFETLVELNESGVDARLTICGTAPPVGFKHEKLTVIPFLDKNDTKQLAQLTQLYLDADFFLLPTRAECAAIAFCEASAFGVPSFTTDTGGIADFVEDDVNGYRLSLAARGSDFALAINRVFENQEVYNRLRISSRQLFEQRLNWDVWGKEMKLILESHFRPHLRNSRFRAHPSSVSRVRAKIKEKMYKQQTISGFERRVKNHTCPPDKCGISRNR
ncbi:glycosyltransferase family 4 protein [Hymenobacter sp. BT770]|uniref:glycosyltransferase family 4 protein n=1 Tax=Hymenobacter sp. BT770 TaxID=2886942 RepID=UPI001D12DD46|nr:glycosyltransferase family 4 protein [Hymenobacter sp. BT770]MCC3155322.1 glycosyltransferase family 4 protein [Hymenobacter sp. BT770]MDO3417319.1 glycosyltransferase family 4 protein [Hymenobacter sp. BT770]